jgi:hypothetical protein
MTKNQTEETRETVQAVTAPKHKIEAWLEDPFASAFLATGITATAITSVLTGMWFVSVMLG